MMCGPINIRFPEELQIEVLNLCDIHIVSYTDVLYADS